MFTDDGITSDHVRAWHESKFKDWDGTAQKYDAKSSDQPDDLRVLLDASPDLAKIWQLRAGGMLQLTNEGNLGEGTSAKTREKLKVCRNMSIFCN